MYDAIVKKNTLCFISIYNKKEIQIFVMTMTMFHLKRAKRVYFIIGFATHEI